MGNSKPDILPKIDNDQPKRTALMDTLDKKLLNELQKNARTSLSDLAIDLKITRATVRVRMNALIASGVIVGFTVLTKSDVTPQPVRGLMMLEIEGTGANRIRQTLLSMPQVACVHTTNGKWDMIVDIGTQTLVQFDECLFKVRKISGVKGSETNLLLSTKSA
jgi:DNA-binding Lrp family transcriptional regulator